jgi:hypothetical protein
MVGVPSTIMTHDIFGTAPVPVRLMLKPGGKLPVVVLGVVLINKLEVIEQPEVLSYTGVDTVPVTLIVQFPCTRARASVTVSARSASRPPMRKDKSRFLISCLIGSTQPTLREFFNAATVVSAAEF